MVSIVSHCLASQNTISSWKMDRARVKSKKKKPSQAVIRQNARDAVVKSAVKKFKDSLNLPTLPIVPPNRPVTLSERDTYTSYRIVAATADAEWTLNGNEGKRTTTDDEVDAHQDYLDAVFNANQAHDDAERRRNDRKNRRSKKKAAPIPIPSFATGSPTTTPVTSTTPVCSRPKKSKQICIDTPFIPFTIATDFPGLLSAFDLDTHWKRNKELALQHTKRGANLIYGLSRPINPKFSDMSIDLHAVAKDAEYTAVQLCQADLFGYPDYLDNDQDNPVTYMIPANGQHFKPIDVMTGRADMFKRILAAKFHPQFNYREHLFLLFLM